MARLVLQTNIPGELHVWVVDQKNTIHHLRRKVAWHGSDRALLLVDHVLRSARLRPSALTSITVVRGPGPFTAVRTGLIIANTFGVVLRIPVCGITSSTLLQTKQILSKKKVAKQKLVSVRPFYGREPNITRAKKKTLR